MAKVSIIVPVYNTEKYLQKCLDSLVGQTLQDIEIICVNDASTDKSLDILKEYAQKDSRIKIIEQEHLKQGAARNNGTGYATGEYIGYVDSDDWIDLDYYERLYNAAKKYDLDIALANNVRIGKNKYKKRLEIKEEKVYDELQKKIDICKQWKNECPTNKIYRNTLLRDNKISWPEGVYCEDKLFTIKAIYYANGIVTVPDINYYYFKNPKSTVSWNARRHKKEYNRDKNNARKAVLDFLKSKKVNIRDKEFWAIKSQVKFLGITLIKTKISIYTEKTLLLGFIPIIYKEFYKYV